MPIRAENKARYPDDWKAISKRVRDEAGQRCEWCKVPNGVLIRRGATSDGRHVWRLCSDSAYMDGFCAKTGETVPNTMEDEVGYGPAVKIVLTVAHLDHTPENCAPENLKALCQKCHITYDAPRKAAERKAKNVSGRAIGDLFN